MVLHKLDLQMNESLLCKLDFCLFRTQWKKPWPFQSCRTSAVSNFLGLIPVWLLESCSLPQGQNLSYQYSILFISLSPRFLSPSSFFPIDWVWLRRIMSILSGFIRWTQLSHLVNTGPGGQSFSRTSLAFFFWLLLHLDFPGSLTYFFSLHPLLFL